MNTYLPAEDAIGRERDGHVRGTATEARPLTVMLLADELSPDGGERQFLNVALGLNKERFRVLMTTVRPSSFLEDEMRDVPGLAVRTLDLRGPLSVTVAPRLAAMMRREQVDVIQCSPLSAAVGMMAARIAGTPVKIVSRGHGDCPSGAIWSLLMDRLVRRADALVVDCELAARHWLGEGIPHAKLQVIYEAVCPEDIRVTLQEREMLRSDLGVLDESWLIGVAGRLTPGAGHGNFLQAASILRAEAPGTKFLVVGHGPSQAELQRRATILGLDGSIIFAGPQVRTAPYFAAMDVAVVPALDGGFGLQAMGLGRPIVAVDAGVNAELFPMGEAGLIVPPDNPIILAHAILELMRHPDAVERMRNRGRKLFEERFTIQKMISAYEELYQDLWSSYRARRAPAEVKSGRSS